MEGLIIWAHSYCRSTLGFFRGLGTAFNVPMKICIWITTSENRKKVGFTKNEFSDMDITFIGNNYTLAYGILEKYKNYHQIFGAYQSVPIYQRLILEAKSMGCRIGIVSEAPCNMTAGIKRFSKDVYIKFVLPYKVKKQIEASDFIINLSGDDYKSLENIGWSKDKIIPCGYYSPRIEGTKIVRRNHVNWTDFSILLSGLHQWHRSPTLLIQALVELKNQGFMPKCYITQDGPLLKKMKHIANNNQLSNVKFLGFVEMDELINLYETCSVYIGAGNYEPWGMRLNDVLQCGAPLIVNKGMGGNKFIEEYACGLTFERNDYKGLASAIRVMMTDEKKYLEFASNAANAVQFISPEYKSNEIFHIIRNSYKGW